MNQFDELLKKLNDSNIIQKTEFCDEYRPNEMRESILIKWRTNTETHKWYETSIAVFKLHGRLLGVRHISNLLTEVSSIESINFKLEFYEMDEFKTVSYKIAEK